MFDWAENARSRMSDAEKTYLANLDGLQAQYERDGREIRARFDAVKDECDARVKAAHAAMWNEVRGLNADYRARAARMAGECLDGLEIPDGIEAARTAMDATIGGACRDVLAFNADAARAAVENVIVKRIQREEAESRRGRRHGGRVV